MLEGSLRSQTAPTKLARAAPKSFSKQGSHKPLWQRWVTALAGWLGQLRVFSSAPLGPLCSTRTGSSLPEPIFSVISYHKPVKPCSVLG